MRNINVPLPDELHTKLKVQCAIERKPMTDIIRKLVEEYIRKAADKKK